MLKLSEIGDVLEDREAKTSWRWRPLNAIEQFHLRFVGSKVIQQTNTASLGNLPKFLVDQLCRPGLIFLGPRLNPNPKPTVKDWDSVFTRLD